MPYLSLYCKAETWGNMIRFLYGVHLSWILVERIFLFQLPRSFNQNVYAKIEKLKIITPYFFFQNTYESAYAHLKLIRGCDKAKLYFVFVI